MSEKIPKPRHSFEEMEIEQEAISKLNSISPEAAAFYRTIGESGISKQEFADRVAKFNTIPQSVPEEGPYIEVKSAFTPERMLKMKIYENGRISIATFGFFTDKFTDK